MEGLTTQQVMASYSRVFSTQDGIIILGDILSQLGYFSNQPSEIRPECIAVANTILSRCGLLNSSSAEIYIDGISHAINTAIAMKSRPVKEDDDNEI